MDYAKLGRLIEKCRKNGVSRLKVGEVEVTFGEEVSKVDFTPHPLDKKHARFLEGIKTNSSEENTQAELSEEEKQQILAEQAAFDEDMLHITDPAAWQRSLLDPEAEDSEAVGGDEESELNYAH